MLKRAIHKYGVDNFSKEILFIFETEDEMNAKEKELVIIEPNSYNLCEGGQGGFGYINKNLTGEDKKIRQAGMKHVEYLKTNPEYRQKVSDKLKLRWTDPAYRLRISEANKGLQAFLGKTHTEETKAKIGLANSRNIGKKNSQYGTCWIWHPQLGNKKIDKSDLITYTDQGYIKGRKIK